MDHHCDDPYMKTRNRQDMKKTGIFKKRFILFGDPGFISQQKCFHQGCFVRYRKTLIRFFDELVPQMIEERRRRGIWYFYFLRIPNKHLVARMLIFPIGIRIKLEGSFIAVDWLKVFADSDHHPRHKRMISLEQKDIEVMGAVPQVSWFYVYPQPVHTGKILYVFNSSFMDGGGVQRNGAGGKLPVFVTCSSISQGEK